MACDSEVDVGRQVIETAAERSPWRRPVQKIVHERLYHLYPYPHPRSRGTRPLCGASAYFYGGSYHRAACEFRRLRGGCGHRAQFGPAPVGGDEPESAQAGQDVAMDLAA